MTKENLIKLDTWFELVRGEKNLSIDEARHLNDKIRKLPPNRQELMEELVLGTMYVVYDFLKTFNFIESLNGPYDIDDLINSFCEVWIENLEQGLYKKDDFSKLFNGRFFDKVNEKLGISEKNSLFPHIRKNDFDDMFFDYFDLLNNGEVVEYEEFMKNIEKYNRIRNLNLETRNSLTYEYTVFYKLLNRCYEIYSCYGNHDIPYSKGYIKFLRDFLIEKALSEYEDSYNVGYKYDSYDVLFQKEKKQTIMEVLDTLPERERKIIKLSLGFEDEMTQRAIGKTFEPNYSGARIGQLEKVAMRKLRNPYRKRRIKDYEE